MATLEIHDEAGDLEGRLTEDSSVLFGEKLCMYFWGAALSNDLYTKLGPISAKGTMHLVLNGTGLNIFSASRYD